MAGYKDVLKKIATDALGEENVEEFSKYGKAAIDAGKKATQKIGNKIDESDNETVKLAKDIFNSVKETVKNHGESTSVNAAADQVTKDLKLRSAVCPNCNAALEVADGIDTFYCQYCGTKVILENQSNATIRAKETVKKLEHKEAMADKMIERLNARAERKAEEKRKQEELQKKLLPFCIIILLSAIIVPLSVSKSHEKKAQQEDATLQIVFEEIQNNISQGNYDEALIKSNNLHFTSGYSNDLKRKWDNTREAIIEQINELKDEEKAEQEALNVAEEQEAEDVQESTLTAQDTAALSPTPKKDNLYYHSSGDIETARQGNSGVYAYKSRGGEYEIYYIIDFDEGYVYRFRNDEDTCERLRIDSGDLKTYIVITYHDGGDTWENALNFKYTTNPDHLILQDGYDEYDFYGTDLEDALKMKSIKTIVDY